MKRELDELEVREKERDKFYEAKLLEMEEFKETVRRRVLDARLEVESMRSSVSKVSSFFTCFKVNLIVVPFFLFFLFCKVLVYIEL